MLERGTFHSFVCVIHTIESYVLQFESVDFSVLFLFFCFYFDGSVK